MTCYRASSNVGFNGHGELQNVYPPPPTYDRSCPINVDYDTLPDGFPMRKTVLGPTSLKRLYQPRAPDGSRFYPTQSMLVPKGTMYDMDSGKLGPHGVRIAYGKKYYPYQHRHPRELSEFAPNLIPMPDERRWTTYHTISDGAWGK